MCSVEETPYICSNCKYKDSDCEMKKQPGLMACSAKSLTDYEKLNNAIYELQEMRKTITEILHDLDTTDIVCEEE
ncbi:MAG: hypothetical protein Q4E88_02890 [Coriobacteriia bacterium]|nr:hypothetical protein [Coriobacteriia bacterium]